MDRQTHNQWKNMNTRLLKALGITKADIARQAGITRQAVAQGSPKRCGAAVVLLMAARFNQDLMAEAQQLHEDLGAWLYGSN